MSECRADNRTMLNGMLWITRSGAQWRELPEAYSPWQSVYARYAKWRSDGTLENVFHAPSEDADMENLSIDSTCIKVHESANGGEETEDIATILTGTFGQEDIMRTRLGGTGKQ